MGNKVKIKSGHIQSHSIDGRVTYKPLTITCATGTISEKSFVILDGHSNVVAATIAAPVQGWFLVLTCPDADNAVTCKLTAGTFDGTNNTATFSVNGTLMLFGVSSTRFDIIQTVGTVTLTST